MMTRIKTFLQAEDGAAVVDMTLLMAGLVGLAIAVSSTVSNGMEDLTGDLETTLINHNVSTSF